MSAPATAVVISAYTMRRWDDICAAIGSLVRQSVAPREVILVVDSNAELVERARASLVPILPTLQVKDFKGGASAARNHGLNSTDAEIVAFLDDDARPEPTWLEELVAPFDDPNVLIVGGQVLPNWPATGRPRWFPSEFLWVVGACYTGMPTVRSEIRNPIAASMAARRSALITVGGFLDAIGRGKGIDIGCEETDLAIRVRKAFPTGIVVYQPSAVVYHRVTDDRMTLGYFLGRCVREGRSKAHVRAETGDNLGPEREYTRHVLPKGFGGYLRSGVRGDVTGFQRAGALAAGLLTTVGAFGVAKLKVSRRPPLPLEAAGE